MELFLGNLTAQKNKIEADFKSWHDAIRDRSPNDAKKSAERIKNRLKRLVDFLDANGPYIEVLDANLESFNKFRLESIGLKDTSQISSGLRDLKRAISELRASIFNSFGEFNTYISMKDWTGGPISYNEMHGRINSAWSTNLPEIESLVSGEIIILSKDIRELMKSKKLGKGHIRVLELLIKAEQEMNKLK